MATPTMRALRQLDGLFCVYKPPGVHWKLVRDTVETNLLKGLNALPSPPCPTEVRFLTEPRGGADSPRSPVLSVTSVPVLSVTSVPVLSHHSLVTGPQLQQLKVGVGHRLDKASSGVLVLGVGHGNRVLDLLHTTRTSRDYVLKGTFGKATDDFCDTGRVVERTTYGHITLDKLNRVLAMLQGVNQKAMLMLSNVDMRSQEAYELAAQGSIGPDSKSVPILTGLRCIDFQPPNFTLEVQCLNETQKYLRKVVHEIGLELRSTAACAGVRRTRDGAFALRNALLRQRWTAADITQAVQQHDQHRKEEEHRSRSHDHNHRRNLKEPAP